MIKTHGKEVKEPVVLFENITPHALCEFFEKYLPEKFDSRTLGLPPITARFLMGNNTFVSFIMDNDVTKKHTEVALAEYNTGSLTGMCQALKGLYAIAEANKAKKDKDDLKVKKEIEKKNKELMDRVKKERAVKNG